MNRSVLPLLILVAALALTGCASTAPRMAAIERMTPEQLAALKPVSNPVLPLEDVVALSRAGTASEEIIKRLRDTRTIHLLSAQQIVDLGKQGVDQTVIDYMVDTQEKARQARLLTELADRDAAQAKKLRNEQQRRRSAEQSYYGSGGFSYGYPRYGWGSGYYAPYPYPFRRMY